MNIFLTAIARLEHDYIREFVSHYKNIGITKIFLYDNGQGNEPTFDSILQDYIDDGFVEIVNYRDKKVCQIDAYNDFYKNHGNECDWCIVCDCDEFLRLKEDKSAEEYLSREIFSDKDVILVNWITYGDNNLIYKYSNDIVNRFTEPSETPFYNNNLPKAIIRGGLSDIVFTDSVHMPSYKESIVFCSEDGVVLEEKNKDNVPLPWIIQHKCVLACFNHYKTKSLQEFCEKIKRGYPDKIIEDYPNELKERIKDYFFINDITMEKLNFLEKNMGLIYIPNTRVLGAKELSRKMYKSLY